MSDGRSLCSRRRKNFQPLYRKRLPSSGEGVDVYIVDSGINHIHGLDGINIKQEFVCEDDDTTDNRNHGIPVASLVTSETYGSAKKANLYAYKIDVNEEVNEQCVLDALKQIRAKIKDRKSQSGYKGSVVNLSLNIPASDTLETRIALLIQDKIAVVTTPGNTNEDSKGIFPCSYEGVICVGAMNKNYDRWEQSSKIGSGFGEKVTLWAPGQEVSSYNNDGDVGQFTGTSYAAPLVAGIIATYYGFEGPIDDLDTVRERLDANVESGILSGLKSKSPNKLANNGYQKAGEDDSKPYIDAGKKKPDVNTASTTATSAPVTSSSPSPTSKVVIAFDHRGGGYNWEFFTAPITQTSFDFCSPYTSYTITPTPTVAASAALPTGTFSIGEVGKLEEENGCVYTNLGNGNGTMSCDGVGGFDCLQIDGANYATGSDCTNNAVIDFRIQCEW